MSNSTKKRILNTSRPLFNEFGYGNVKIADIAEALDMSVGNLWYHFKDRRSILEAIASEYFEYAAIRMKLRPEGREIIQEFVTFIEAFFEEVAHFRFLFRDQADFGSHGEEASKTLPDVHAKTLKQFNLYITELKRQGKMAIQDEKVEILSESLALQVRYSLEFYREGSIENEPYEKTEVKAVNMVCFIVETFLTSSAATEFKTRLIESVSIRQQNRSQIVLTTL